MFISGCIPFRNKKEKKAAWKQLKREFDNNIKIYIENGFLTYTSTVDRNFI